MTPTKMDLIYATLGVGGKEQNLQAFGEKWGVPNYGGGGGLSPEGLWLFNPFITSDFIQLIRIQCGHFQ
jgi:hypothetical protein